VYGRAMASGRATAPIWSKSLAPRFDVMGANQTGAGRTDNIMNPGKDSTRSRPPVTG